MLFGRREKEKEEKSRKKSHTLFNPYESIEILERTSSTCMNMII